MRTHFFASLIALTLIAGAAQAAPWTYRGSLSDGGQPANGRYDIRLTLLDTGGKRTLIGPITFDDVAVTNGNFAIDVDFGVDLSNASAMKLKTEVGERGANFVALGELSTFDPKATLAGVCWDTQGNAGTNPATDFLGTSDGQALAFRVGNSRRLLLDTALNTIGGSDSNSYDFGGFAQTIGGGGVPTMLCGANLNQSCRNSTVGASATIAGGVGNIAAAYSVVGGGNSNVAGGQYAFVGGGFANSAGFYGAVAGGQINRADGGTSFVGGGYSNRAGGGLSAIAGGLYNCAGGDASFAGGAYGKVRVGSANGACVVESGDDDGDEGTFLWSDSSTDNAFVSSGPNQFAVRATGGLRWDGTGVNSTTSPALAHQINTATNTCDGGSGANTRTFLDHPLLNNNPNAILVITPNFGLRSSGVSPPFDRTFGVYYSDNGIGGCPVGRWVIYQLSATSSVLSNGARFNVWFVIP